MISKIRKIVILIIALIFLVQPIKEVNAGRVPELSDSSDKYEYINDRKISRYDTDGDGILNEEEQKKYDEDNKVKAEETDILNSRKLVSITLIIIRVISVVANLYILLVAGFMCFDYGSGVSDLTYYITFKRFHFERKKFWKCLFGIGVITYFLYMIYTLKAFYFIIDLYTDILNYF